MDKLFIYGGITLGSIIGAYIPVLLLGSSPLGIVSMVGGVIGSIVGLWLGYKANRAFGD